MRRVISSLRQAWLLGGDLLAVVCANALATVLRFDFDWQVIANPRYHNFRLLCLDLALTPIVFYMNGLYRGYWRYAGLHDLLSLCRAVTLKTMALVVFFYVMGFTGHSRAVVVIAAIVMLLLAGALRVAPRFHLELISARGSASGRKTLIIGAGDTGEALLRELRKSPRREFHPIGFIDDDPAKSGFKIHDVPVLGTSADLAALIAEHSVEEVILAIPGATGVQVRHVHDICRRAGVRIRTVPTRGEIDRGVARIGQIRIVELEDLLGRQVVSLDQQALRQSLRGGRVLVTGAGGSIGREIARQVAAYEPEALWILDRNENQIFYLEAELRQAHPQLALNVVIGDVLDTPRMQGLFALARPTMVLHAAAYKHVPLMESNPCEAVKNNVLATHQLARLAARHRVDRFIYISTDKAVRPSSIMGATKRLGERLVKALADEGTRFITVRFGNVMGSDGSVIPTFRRQIAAGGPITVTHPEASRFFMTIPEAVQLVLTAGAMGEGGETFLLRMGEPVRIVDLARHLIELSGLQPDVDIAIRFTGLRPGEKLHEELQSDGEHALPTSNDKIMVLTGVEPLGPEGMGLLEELESAARGEHSQSCVQILRSLVPDFVPASVLIASAAAGETNVVEISGKRRLDAQG
jgi:FlaA1/EpsC-like NDP-sugar epimerase